VISPARYYHTKILIDEISQNACQPKHVTCPQKKIFVWALILANLMGELWPKATGLD